METHVTGQPVLGELRQQVLAVLLGHPLFSEAEQLRANHFVHECEDDARLTRWLHNVQAEVSRREAEARAKAARQRRTSATHHLLRRLHPASFRSHRPRQPRPVPAWRPGAPLPCRPDYQAGTFDRRAAARFQPAATLGFAHLLALQPQ